MNTAAETDGTWAAVWSAVGTDSVMSLVLLILLGLFILQLLFLIVIVVQGRQIRRLRRRTEFRNGDDGGGLHGWHQLQPIQEDVQVLKQELTQVRQALVRLEQQQKDQVGRVGIVRYNAFREGGHELSFSIAWLNQHQDGVVVTSIYVRGESNVYAKPVIGGQSPYPLTEEEQMAIRQAMEERIGEAQKKSTADAPLIRAR